MTPFDCPRCGTTLTMAERHGIEIDYCPQCRGVWLDRGELDKIIERGGPGVAAAPSTGAQPAGGWTQPMAAPAYPPPQPWSTPKHHGDWDDRRKYDKRHDGYHGRKPKNWLSELFD